MVSELLSQGSLGDLVGKSGWLCGCVVWWRGSAEEERGPAVKTRRRPGGAQMGEKCHLWHPLRRDWWAHKDPREKFLVRTI